MQGRTALAACVGVGLVLSACAVESPGTNRGSQESVVSRGGPDQEQPGGDVASWLLSEDQLLDPTTSFLVLDVTRLGCSGGVTGSVLDPVVVYEPDRVVIRTDVEPVGGANDCQGNDAVAVEIALDESLGMRELVDAACLHGEAVGTAACPGAVRWAPPEGLERHGGVPDWQARRRTPSPFRARAANRLSSVSTRSPSTRTRSYPWKCCGRAGPTSPWRRCRASPTCSTSPERPTRKARRRCGSTPRECLAGWNSIPCRTPWTTRTASSSPSTTKTKRDASHTTGTRPQCGIHGHGWRDGGGARRVIRGRHGRSHSMGIRCVG